MQIWCIVNYHICFMNKLGFKNFRRFIELKPLSYSGITFLVGRNNSGKSTFVKAMILLIEYLKSDNFKVFPISTNINVDYNLITFERIKNFNCKENDVVEFQLEIDNFSIEIKISALPDAKIANVHELIIKDIDEQFEYNFSILEETIYLKYNDEVKSKQKNSEFDDIIKGINEDIKRIRTELSTLNSKRNIKETTEKRSELKKLLEARKSLSKLNKSYLARDNSFNISCGYSVDNFSLFEALNEVINSNLDYYENDMQGDASNENENNKKDFESFAFKVEDIRSSIKRLRTLFQDLQYRYLSSYSAKQTSLYFINDRYNSLAQALDDFYKRKINIGEPAFEFVRRWMREFDVGDDFKIIPHADEAYEIRIIQQDKSLVLADKGMGSVQIMLLLFRLAVIIDLTIRDSKTMILFIEEPELNLHPALQSKLTDLFHEVFDKYKIQLIAETHSEYIIRKTQLIVKKQEYEVKPNENPFSVIYFDIDLIQWNMNYREDGKFIEDFGKGFYDESSLLTLNLL
jgi:predicted ATP-dependent endonuclease of OLD family